ncbi:MAG: zf-TFIIB domain-containing protein [Planctomycetes bacterium]|nr:zf-TFIIB domain-containing protein [Planctomycetota bacterium]
MEELVCARCPGSLQEVQIGDVTLERCEQCQGFFFDSDELAQVLTDASPGAPIADDRDPSEAGTSCPRCQIPMDRVPAKGVGRFSYDLCSACHGLWLDACELAHLERAGVTTLDVGKDVESRRRRAAVVIEQMEGLLGEIEGQREERLGRLEKLMEYGLSEAREIRSIRSAIEAEALLARQALGRSRLFEEARRFCIEGLITGAQFESLRQRVVL